MIAGPPHRWLLGQIPEIFTEGQHHMAERLCSEYGPGPFVFLLGGRPVIMTASPDASRQGQQLRTLVQRSAVGYSTAPQPPPPSRLPLPARRKVMVRPWRHRLFSLQRGEEERWDDQFMLFSRGAGGVGRLWAVAAACMRAAAPLTQRQVCFAPPSQHAPAAPLCCRSLEGGAQRVAALFPQGTQGGGAAGLCAGACKAAARTATPRLPAPPAAPSLPQDALEKQLPLFRASAARLAGKLGEAADEGREVDVWRALGAMTLDVVGTAAFG